MTADPAANAAPETVGLLGGVFDPPHLGHVELVRTAMRELALDRLVVVVTGIAPHKPVETDGDVRYRLAAEAFGGIPGVELSRHELELATPSYTVETARWASRQFADPIFTVGADEFADFLSWKDPNGVVEHVRLAVASRPGYDRDRLAAVRESLERPERVLFFEIDPVRLASRDVRARVARGERIDDLVPAGVARLIAEHGLYRDA